MAGDYEEGAAHVVSHRYSPLNLRVDTVCQDTLGGPLTRINASISTLPPLGSR
jgi:hypothetical protein